MDQGTLDFSRHRLVEVGPNDDPFIHPMASVHPSARIGPRSRVWQFASVIRNARIGADCSIASCAIVDGSVLGDGCIVSHGAFIDPGMIIENDVFIGPQVSLCNDYWPRTSKDGWFDMDDLVNLRSVVTFIENGASIGANAVLMPGLHIGPNAMIAAGSVVTKNVPPNCLWKRDGTIVKIDASRLPERRRSVK